MDKEYLIKKWLADELTEAERSAFEALDDFEGHKKVIDGAQYFKASNISEAANINDFLKKVSEEKNSDHKKLKSYFPLLKIAAIFVVVVGIASLFLIDKNTSIQTLVSEKKTIELPDASTVVINSKSEIVFNKNDWEDKRKINLVGEAFFKVKKGSAFTVVTEAGEITVLGTQFNVKNRENYFEVQCFEGLVRVQSKEHTKNLPAGSTFFIIDDVVSFSNNLSYKAPQWIHNRSSFKSVPFYQVLNEFERQYEVTFSLVKIDTLRIFSGGFVHTNLEEALKSVTLPLDLKYNIDSEQNITLFNVRP